jgi:hypothetical protein
MPPFQQGIKYIINCQSKIEVVNQVIILKYLTADLFVVTEVFNSRPVCCHTIIHGDFVLILISSFLHGVRIWVIIT